MPENTRGLCAVMTLLFSMVRDMLSLDSSRKPAYNLGGLLPVAAAPGEAGTTAGGRDKLLGGAHARNPLIGCSRADEKLVQLYRPQ
jgi:hypothetical protein